MSFARGRIVFSRKAEVCFERGRSVFCKGSKCILHWAEVSYARGRSVFYKLPECLDEGPKRFFFSKRGRSGSGRSFLTVSQILEDIGLPLGIVARRASEIYQDTSD